jgi:hypothetical protein
MPRRQAIKIADAARPRRRRRRRPHDAAAALP